MSGIILSSKGCYDELRFFSYARYHCPKCFILVSNLCSRVHDKKRLKIQTEDKVTIASIRIKLRHLARFLKMADANRQDKEYSPNLEVLRQTQQKGPKQ